MMINLKPAVPLLCCVIILFGSCTSKKSPEAASDEPQTPTPEVASDEPQTPTPEAGSDEPQTPIPETASEEPQTPTPEVASDEPQTPTFEAAADEPQTPTPEAASDEPQTPIPETASDEPQDQRIEPQPDTMPIETSEIPMDDAEDTFSPVVPDAETVPEEPLVTITVIPPEDMQDRSSDSNMTESTESDEEAEAPPPAETMPAEPMDQPDTETTSAALPESPPDMTPNTQPGAPDNSPMTAVNQEEQEPKIVNRILEQPGEISLLMEGRGWIFRSDLSTSGNWQFIDRKREGHSTRFQFDFPEPGTWDLYFDRQDLSGGNSERQIRRIIVGGSISDTSTVTDSDIIDMDNTVSGSIEDLKEKAAAQTEEGARAREAIMQYASANGNIPLLLDWLPPYLKDRGNPDTLDAALTVLEPNPGYDNEIIQLLERLLEFESDKNSSKWLFNMASRLEKPGEYRNLSRSVSLYKKIIENWPHSQWYEDAENRLNWLNRHYFRIR